MRHPKGAGQSSRQARRSYRNCGTGAASAWLLPSHARATARGPRCRFASGARASGSVPGCSQGTSFDRLRAHCPGARFALAKRKSAPRRPGARCSSQASVRPLNSATFASPHESRSAPVPSPVPRLSAEAHGTGEPPPCRSQLRWQAYAIAGPAPGARPHRSRRGMEATGTVSRHQGTREPPRYRVAVRAKIARPCDFRDAALARSSDCGDAADPGAPPVDGATCADAKCEVQRPPQHPNS